ncbi:MAG TPA: hypothetical protein VKB19_14000, partial [Pedobacter sp.]|nr:hypothetical protein [Pedobacter sp.]
MKSTTNVLFITLNMFESTGGIQKVCRTLAHSLFTTFAEHLRVLSLGDSLPDSRYIPNSNF